MEVANRIKNRTAYLNKLKSNFEVTNIKFENLTISGSCPKNKVKAVYDSLECQ